VEQLLKKAEPTRIKTAENIFLRIISLPVINA